jgi:hypothetical protein
MTGSKQPPIACTLTPGDYRDRLSWITQLARDALRGSERHDLGIELRYAPEAAARVREMVRREQLCCAFLTFDLRESPEEIQLTVRAPEEARGALDTIFGQFLASGAAPAADPERSE